MNEIKENPKGLSSEKKGELSFKIRAADFVKDYGVNLGFHLFDKINNICIKKKLLYL